MILYLTLYDANEEVIAHFGVGVFNSVQGSSGELHFTLPDDFLDGLYYIGVTPPNDPQYFNGILGSSSYTVAVTAREGSVPALTMGDTVTGTDGNDLLFGTVNGDIEGKAGDDWLYGRGSEGILINGGDGNDRLYGGAGNDTFYGGKGRDTHLWRRRP